MTEKHKPLPWSVFVEVPGAPPRIHAPAEFGRGCIGSFSRLEDAEFSVAAVNAHDGLVARVAELEDELRAELSRRLKAEARLGEERRYLLADEERRKLTGDAISAESEATALRAQNAALREALENMKYWLHIIAEPVKPERSFRALQELAVRAIQGAPIPPPQSARAALALDKGEGRG